MSSHRATACLATLGLLWAGAAVGSEASPGEPPERRNVLLVSVDTLRPDALGCYGSPRASTPYIDSLAARGVRFEWALAPTPLTLPSHASLLTGREPPGHGLRDNSGFLLADGVETLAGALQKGGYATGAFVAALPLDSQFGLDRGFDHYDDRLTGSTRLRAATAMAERGAEEVADATIGWLELQQDSRWFAWVHFYDPHAPYDPPERFAASGDRTAYAGEVSYVDEQIGRLLAWLTKRQWLNETLVVLTADHGESLGEHGELTHGIFAYESTLRVPLIFAPFDTRVEERRVRLIDLAPTILDLQGLSFDEGVDGESLAPLLRGESAEGPPSPSYFEALTMHLNMGWAPLRGIYAERFKYIELPIAELYDLDVDRGESKNLCVEPAACEAWGERLVELAGVLVSPRPEVGVDPQMQAQLEALGYVAGGSSGEHRRYGPGDDPKRLVGLWNRVNAAVAAHQQGRHESALAELAAVAAERPSMPLAYLKRAAIQDELGQLDAAIATLEQAVSEGAGGVFVERELGLLLVRKGRVDEAVRHLQRAEQEGPDRLDVLDALASAYLAAGQSELAERTYRRALSIDDSSVRLHLQLGTLLMLIDRVEEAVDAFRSAVNHGPDVAQAHTGLGLALASSGRRDEAMSSWQRALELDRSELSAMLQLGFAYLERGDRARATPLLEEFLESAPPERYAREIELVRSTLGRAGG